MIWNAYSEEKEVFCGLTIRSGGHIFAKQGRRVSRPSGRKDWLLFYVAKGSETFYFNRPRRAEEGSFVLFRPGEPQNHLCEAKNAEFYYIHFTVEDGYFPWELPSSEVCHTPSGAAVCALFESVLEELQLKQSCYERVCIGKLITLLSLMQRKNGHASVARGKDFGKIAYAVQYIHKNYNKNEPLEVYAEMCSLSKFHFLRKFREMTGLSPIAYKNRLRIDHAKALLEEGDLSVNEVGEAVGYASPSCFCDAFKKEAGVSPGKYRKSKGDQP